MNHMVSMNCGAIDKLHGGIDANELGSSSIIICSKNLVNVLRP